MAIYLSLIVKNLKSNLHHIFPYVTLWVTLILVWYLFKWKDFPSLLSGILVSVIDASFVILCIYLANRYLIPKYYKLKKYLGFVGLLFALIILCGFIIVASHFILVRETLLAHGKVSYIYVNTLVTASFFTLFFFTSLGAAIQLTMDRLDEEKKYLQLEKEKLKAELNALKNQVNPHFLFNAMNTLYYKIDRTNNDARETLLLISDLLRYHIYQTDQEKIPIEQELAFIQKYILLQKERINPDCLIIINGIEETKGFSIVPFLLIPLVENCFKHLAHSTDRSDQINIKVAKEGEWFIFNALNTTENSQKGKVEVGSGIGLYNVRNRLKLEYPGQHKFEIKNGNGLFEVNLSIQYGEA